MFDFDSEPMERNSSSWVWKLFLALLTLILITLKLCGVITWSWWMVLAPMWFPAAFIIVMWIFLVFVIRKFFNRY